LLAPDRHDRTPLNRNSSRFGKFTKVQYDAHDNIAGAQIQVRGGISNL